MHFMAAKQLTIAVDGPAGAGKSTVTKELAKRFNYIYIDTGAMYRAITLKALCEGIDVGNTAQLIDLTGRCRISFGNMQQDVHSVSVFLDDNDVSLQIRNPEVTQNVSVVSQIPQIRELLMLQQRALAANGGVVMDGRDIGTVVLPDADIKFFLTASIDERTLRRYNELVEKGYSVDYAKLKEEILQRDEMDATRDVAPLKMANDAILIDTTNLTVEEVVQKMAAYCQERLSKKADC